MKWGRKKPLPSSSSSFSSSIPHCSQPSSLISHVFPLSWLSKFKHKSTSNSEPKPRKLNPKGKLNSPMTNTPPKRAIFVGSGNGNDNGTLYGFKDDGDAFWRLSFGQDGAGEKSKRVSLKSSVWYDSDDDEDQLKVSVLSCPNCRRKEAQKSSVMQTCKRDEKKVLRSPKSAKTARELRSKLRRKLGNAEKRSTCSYVSPTAVRSPGLRAIEEEEEEYLNLEQTKGEISEDKMNFDWLSLKELGKSKSEDKRKSLYVSMEPQRKRTKQSKNNNNKNRVRAYSPRAEACKVKALEEMRKAKLKKKKQREAKTGLDSFAVVKSSYDPQKDFKDSMVEMILEKKMSQPNELEELLACYLTLNSDDYHDMIIRVFREVWLELGELRSEQVFSD